MALADASLLANMVDKQTVIAILYIVCAMQYLRVYLMLRAVIS